MPEDICPKCGGELFQTDKNTFTGEVWREYTCRSCGHILDVNEGKALWQILHDDAESQRITKLKPPWYFRKSFIIIAIFSIGPLALPLIWLHPKTTLAWKIGLTIAILLLSCLLFHATMEFTRIAKEYYKLHQGQ